MIQVDREIQSCIRARAPKWKKNPNVKKKSETTRYTNVHGNRTSFTSRIKKNSAQHYAFLYFCIFRILNLFSVGLQKSLLSDGQLEAHRRPEHLKYFFMNCCSFQKHAHASRSHFNIHNHHASTLYWAKLKNKLNLEERNSTFIIIMHLTLLSKIEPNFQINNIITMVLGCS